MTALPPDPLASQIPAAWSVYVPIAASLARHALAILAGANFAWAAAVTDSQLQVAVGLTFALAAVVWEGWQKIAAARALRTAAAAPAGLPAPKLPA